jgi:hypothetical protein
LTKSFASLTKGDTTMKPNMGNTDRIIRIVAAVVIAALYFAGALSGLAATILLVVAAILVLTSFISFCPLYAPFGISTCRREA